MEIDPEGGAQSSFFGGVWALTDADIFREKKSRKNVSFSSEKRAGGDIYDDGAEMEGIRILERTGIYIYIRVKRF